jgi:NADPH-dependent F420 reductase
VTQGTGDTTAPPEPIVGIVGGTGPAGTALAVRLASAGLTVRLGSRDAHKAATVAAAIKADWGDRTQPVDGVDNAAACDADIVVLAVAADSMIDTAQQLARELSGRVVVCMGNQLTRTKRGFAAVLPAGHSLAEAVQAVAPDAHIVGAYQNLPAASLGDLDGSIDAPVVVCGDDAAAVRAVMDLTARVPGLHPLDGGPLANAVAIEAMTAILVNVNRSLKGEHTLHITHLHPDPVAP